MQHTVQHIGNCHKILDFFGLQFFVYFSELYSPYGIEFITIDSDISYFNMNSFDTFICSINWYVEKHNAKKQL